MFPTPEMIDRFEAAVRANSYRTITDATEAEYQAAKADLSRALYAAPSPQPVSVKALNWFDKSIPLMRYFAECDDDGEWRYAVSGSKMTGPYTLKRYNVHCGEYPTIEKAKDAAQADYESRIRSALSSPVEGGTEKEGLANALEMTGCENEEDLIDMANVGLSLMGAIDIYTKAPSLIENWSPADDPAEIVGDLYSRLEEALASPSPSAEIEALRVENGELRKALEKIAAAPAWGAPERWETTPAEVRQLARTALKTKGEI